MSYDRQHHGHGGHGGHGGGGGYGGGGGGGYGGGGGHRGGGRRGRRDDRWEHEQAPPPPQSPNERMRGLILRFGEADPLLETPKLAHELRTERAATPAGLAEAFRVGVTEQPYKVPFYAALLRELHEPVATSASGAANADENGTDMKTDPDTTEPKAEADADASAQAPLGAQILEEFAKGFRGYLDRLAWRETRLCIHFFAHLTQAGVITVSSMSALLQSFVAVLDEFGVSHRRAKNAALCAAEGIMRAGPSLLASPASTSPEEMLSSIQTYTDSVVSAKGLVQPLVRLHDVDSVPEGVDEVLDSALAALRVLVASDFAETSSVFPDLYSTLPPVRFQPFELPSILVPPEAADYELDTDTTGDGTNDTENSSGMAAAGSGSSTGTVKKEDWPEYMPRFFPDDVTPNPSSPAGYAVRSALIATIDIFEVNRKECARLLLEYPKWAPEGTFRPRPGLPGQPSAAPGAPGANDEGNPKPAPVPVPGKDWQLESTLIETILGMAFLLPEPFAGHKTLYYSTLITELAKLSPTTVGPAVGKSIRRLYSLLGDEGLDPEIGRRFAEWFAVHMSNFGFGWVWKEWIPDLELPGLHPKRVFIRRAVELEVRLAYYDRITKTLPEVYCDPALAAIPAQAPGPSFEYEDPSHAYYDTALSILDDLRSRRDAVDVLSHLDALRNGLLEADERLSSTAADATIRSITVQCLLHIGARSFSHFLNAIERYLPVLRSLAGDGRDGKDEKDAEEKKAGRRGILAETERFWRTNGQMVGIVFDKMMQYQIVDPSDVVAYAFSAPSGASASAAEVTPAEGSQGTSINGDRWELLHAALDKANGRVVVARRKVAALRKEEEERRAKVKAKEGAMEVDAEGAKEEAPVEDSPQLSTALRALSSLTREQRMALLAALQAFVGALSAHDIAGSSGIDVLAEQSWNERAGWGDHEWARWETCAWYKHFCRLYSPYLRTYSNTLGSIAFEKVDEASTSGAFLKKWWSVAILEA